MSPREPKLQPAQRRRKVKAVVAHVAALGTTPRMEAAELRAKARNAVMDEMARNLSLMQGSTPAEQSDLIDANLELSKALQRLLENQLKEVNEDDAIRKALEDIRKATSNLVAESRKTRDAAEAITTATAVVGMLGGLLKLFKPF
jgi:hypothetical protein